MKKVPVWFLITLISFFIGIFSVLWFAFPVIPDDVKPPGELCLSKKFPGKSVAIDELVPENRSVFDNSAIDADGKVILWGQPDQFYAAFAEEIFEKEKFRDARAFPEIAAADEIYRFFWLRTFHHPVMIRLSRKGDDKYLVVKQTDGRGGYEFGKLIVNETRKLKDSEWCEFIRRLDEADFWSKKKIDLSGLANDGAFWNIEGVREQRYYLSGEQSPDTGKFREACIYLMRISGLKIDENSREFY
jgi:hypothetical protein